MGVGSCMGRIGDGLGVYLSRLCGGYMGFDFVFEYGVCGSLFLVVEVGDGELHELQHDFLEGFLLLEHVLEIVPCFCGFTCKL